MEFCWAKISFTLLHRYRAKSYSRVGLPKYLLHWNLMARCTHCFFLPLSFANGFSTCSNHANVSLRLWSWFIMVNWVDLMVIYVCARVRQLACVDLLMVTSFRLMHHCRRAPPRRRCAAHLYTSCILGLFSPSTRASQTTASLLVVEHLAKKTFRLRSSPKVLFIRIWAL